MEKFNFLKKEKISNLPESHGVYSFKKRRGFFYIGKAVNIKNRVKNHFQKSNYKDNFFINEVEKIGYIKTGSEVEALILEANLIKKYKPKYNVFWRDDKNFFFVAVTKESLPRIFITHQTKTRTLKPKLRNAKFIGPFVDGAALKKTLKILRRIFPYYTKKKHQKNLCPWCHLGLCPGPNPKKKDYKRNIKNLISVLKGERKSVLKSLKKEMNSASSSQKYERAARIRDQILALENILTNARILKEIKEDNWEKTERALKKILKTEKTISRIEAFDISNIQGTKATGSMITFINGKPEKNFYRRFKIQKSGKPNDIAMIKEVLKRRFNHPEWKLPDLIFIDGGKAQLNAGIKSKNTRKETKDINVISLAKRENKLYIENEKRALFLKNLSREIFNLILQMRDEAHRFAIEYHKKLRKKDLLS
jgi:excinuclease ABC subunit C